MDADAIVFEEPEQLLARAGPVLIWASRNKLDEAPLARVRAALEAHALDHPEGVALLMIAVGDVDHPTLDNRRRIARGLASLGERLQAVAAVFEGDKRWLAHTRSLFEGILAQLEAAAGGPSFPLRAFADRLDAIVWLTERVVDHDGRPIEVEGLTELVEHSCARLGS
jgi:hypothetical protein